MSSTAIGQGQGLPAVQPMSREERSVSNPATGETTAWDEPLPDFTGVDWAEQRMAGTCHAVLRQALTESSERTGAGWSAAAFYEDAP